MTQNEAAAKAAAEWWADRLQRGDRGAFIVSLQASVLNGLERNGFVELECDYDALGPLLDAVRAAGVECRGFGFSADGILPRKHDLTVRPDRLEPKEGYENWTDHIPVLIA